MSSLGPTEKKNAEAPATGVSYNFIICSAGIVCPSGLLHNLPRDSLKVHQIVASCKRGHSFDALKALGLLWVDILLFLLDGAHVDAAQMF